MNGYFEEINKSKYLALVPTNGSKEKNRKIEEPWSKIRDLIGSMTKNSGDYDKNYMKIKFDLDDDFPLNKVIQIHNVAIVVRAIIHENNKYYLQVFLDECLHKL